VPGVEMAPVRFGLLCGTVGTCNIDVKGESQAYKGKALSTDAELQGRIDR
jgi:hypothetical protein